MIFIRYLAMFFMTFMASAGMQASAQVAGVHGLSTAPAEALPEAAPDASACGPASGPTIYVVDNRARLATINLGTYAVKIIGSVGTLLTDIGFDPLNHQLYGVSFTSFYAIDKTTARTTLKGNLGINDGNALVFNSLGTAYLAGSNSDALYKINISTGGATVIGHMGGWKSAGDLVFYNDMLVLSAYKGGLGPTTPNYLVSVNEKTGAVIGSPVLLNSKEVFGLASTGKNELYGLGITGPSNQPALFQFFPTNPLVNRDKLLKNLAASGLGQIYGAAYDGNYQP